MIEHLERQQASGDCSKICKSGESKVTRTSGRSRISSMQPRQTWQNLNLKKIRSNQK